MKDKVNKENMVSRKDKDFSLWSPYYSLSFACLPPEKQLAYFYISEFEPIDTKGHEKWLREHSDYSYDHRIINPVYQLYIMITQGVRYGFDLFYQILTPEEYDQAEDLFYSLFERYEFCNELYDSFSYNTSEEGFLYGRMWQELRAHCLKMLRAINLEPCQNFENPIQFSYFLYPVNFLEYTPMPYWSKFETYDKETWDKMKNFYDDLYKDAKLNPNIKI